MSEQHVIEQSTVTVNCEALSGVNVIAAIDRGCSLTKILYSSVQDKTHYNLHFALFHNDHFKSALDFMRMKGWVVQDRESDRQALQVTGNGCDRFKDLIVDTLGCEIDFIDEFLTQTNGTLWMLQHISESDLCFSNEGLDYSELGNFDTNMIAKICQASWLPVLQKQQQQQLSDTRFPCVAIFCGSATTIKKLHASGETELISVAPIAGRSFLGLCQLLLGTSDFDKVISMAEAGDKGKVDSQVKDIMLNDPESPYGAFPPEMSVFPWGKGAETGVTYDQVDKNDLAASLVATFAKNVSTLAISVAKAAECTSVYIGGNFFRHQLTRQDAMVSFKLFCGDAVQVRFLNTGHTGAVGAMICTLEQREELAKAMGQISADKQ